MNQSITTYTTLIILLFVLLFGALQMYLFVNITLLLFCSLLLFWKPEVIVSLFVVLLPTNGLYSTEANIMGILGPVTITQLLAFLILFKERRNTSIKTQRHFHIAILFIIFLLLFNVVYEFRNAYYDIYDVTWTAALKRFIKYFFRFGTIYLLICALYKGKYLGVVLNGIHIGVVLLIFSSVFTIQLQDLKFLTTDASEDVAGFFTIERKSGFFGAGDVNSLGGLLATYLGFLLIISYGEVKKTLLFFMLALTFIGVIYTGSRTAIISSTLVMILFLFLKNPIRSKGLNKTILLVLLAFSLSTVFFLFNDQTRILMFRFQEAMFETNINNEGSRLFKWLYYLNDIASNPETLVIGTNHELTVIYSSGFKEQRVPHNFYISALFHSGIIILMIGFVAWFKLIRLSLNEKHLLLIALPTFAISFYVSDWGYFQYFVLFLVLVPYILKNYQNQLR